MAQLNNKTKMYIIERLACFASPSDVRKELLEQNIDCSLSQILYYNPDSLQSDGSAKEWKDLFSLVRKRFIDGEIKIGIQVQTYRMMDLQTIRDACKDSKNYRRWAEILKQAAEEAGGKFTNKLVTSATVDMTVSQSVVDLSALSDDELEMYEQLTAKVRPGDQPQSSS